MPSFYNQIQLLFTYKTTEQTSFHTTGKRGGRLLVTCCLLSAVPPDPRPAGCSPCRLSPHRSVPASLPTMGVFLRGCSKAHFPHSSVNQCLVIFARLKKKDACKYCFTVERYLTWCISYLAKPDTTKNCHNLRKSKYTVNIHLDPEHRSNCKSHHLCSSGSSSHPCNLPRTNPYSVRSITTPSARSSCSSHDVV